jgi:PHD/YefM family antitoxin component YafN of YafNO toxin-antitoxin module
LPKKAKKGKFTHIRTESSDMSLALKLDSIADLPDAPASDVKRLGWRGMMKTIGRQGKTVVTNHNEPEAVILSIEEYEAIARALANAGAKSETALNTLRDRFDERLASLQSVEAGARLRGLMRKPTKLDGKVKAGAKH